MNTYPLTPQGLEDFQEDLSQLTRIQLEAQADAVASDFKTYVKDLFILSSEQEDFVDNLNPRLANYYGASCSICFVQMLPISLVYPPPPGTGYSKWTGSDDKIKASGNKLGELEATGSFTFEMTYRL